VLTIVEETPHAKTFRLRLSEPTGHRAGQHYVVRLTAPDGYQASRSYSVASPPEPADEIELTVERLPGGEVSTFLHDEVVVGDELEVRGPIGGWFVWEGDGPALLIGGGSGVVPLMAMLRLARRAGHGGSAHLVVSVRTPEDLYYNTEMTGPDVTVVYSRKAPPAPARAAGRLAPADLAPLVDRAQTVYVCGTSGFADAATELVVAAGIPADRIRVERFGPTG